MTDARTEHNAAALVTLLPLLESHIDLHRRITSRAQWVSAPEPQPPGYVPPPPEPDCDGACSQCPDFHTSDCHVRQERWAHEWERMRQSYPILIQLEEQGGLMDQLTYHNVRWRLAIYREYVQPWSAWHPSERKGWAEKGVEWLAERVDGWLPVYVPKGMPMPHEGAKDQDIIQLRIEGLSYHAIAKRVRCSKTTVRAVLSGQSIPHRRTKTADRA